MIDRQAKKWPERGICKRFGRELDTSIFLKTLKALLAELMGHLILMILLIQMIQLRFLKLFDRSTSRQKRMKKKPTQDAGAIVGFESFTLWRPIGVNPR